MNNRWNGWFLRSFWSREQKCKKLAGTSRRPNVAMSGQREWKSTSGKRRDLSTSRHQCDLYLTIIKSKRGPKIKGIEERTNEGDECLKHLCQTCVCLTFLAFFMFKLSIFMARHLIFVVCGNCRWNGSFWTHFGAEDRSA